MAMILQAAMLYSAKQSSVIEMKFLIFLSCNVMPNKLLKYDVCRVILEFTINKYLFVVKSKTIHSLTRVKSINYNVIRYIVIRYIVIRYIVIL